MADSHVNLVVVMKEHGISKIVNMSAFGTADSFPNLNFLMRLVIRNSNMCYAFQDHDLVDQEMKESGMEFVLARQVMLTDKEAQPVREHGSSGQGSGSHASHIQEECCRVPYRRCRDKPLGRVYASNLELECNWVNFQLGRRYISEENCCSSMVSEYGGLLSPMSDRAASLVRSRNRSRPGRSRRQSGSRK